MGSGFVAHRARALNRATFAWAVGRALHFAIGTCVVALILATTLSGAASERFATTAYLAAIFAAAALAVGRFLPKTEPEVPAIAAPAFPAFLGNSVAVIIFVSIVAALVSAPAAEGFALAGSAALVVIAVLNRRGVLAAFNAALTRGGPVVAASRYAVLIAVCALAIGSLLGGSNAETQRSRTFRR